MAAGTGILLAGGRVDGTSLRVMSGDTLTLACGSPSDWYVARPVPAAYDRSGAGLPAMAADTLAYSRSLLSADRACIEFVAGEMAGVQGAGTYYIQALPAGSQAADSLRSTEPLHLEEPCMVQVLVRPGDACTDFMMEVLGTPFVMMPRRTPGGAHQADDAMGFDCAGLAVYGARRAGLDVQYLGPQGILRYLDAVVPGVYSPGSGDGPCVYRDSGGLAVPVGEGGLAAGDILHQRAQVCVFLEDRGVEGLLDSGDLVIQSWFDGPMICTLAENGFYGTPLRVMRWSAPRTAP